MDEVDSIRNNNPANSTGPWMMAPRNVLLRAEPKRSRIGKSKTKADNGGLRKAGSPQPRWIARGLV